MSSSQNKAYLFALLSVLLWATVPTAFKIGLRYQDNFQMVTGAAIVAAIILGIVVLVQGKIKIIRSLKGKEILHFATMGLLNPALYYLVLFKAYDQLPGQVAQPLNMTWPLILVIISIPVLGQRVGWKGIISLVISFGGVVIISFQGGTLFKGASNINGILLALGSAFIWAFYWIFNLKSRMDTVVSLFFMFLAGSIYLIILGFFRETAFPKGIEAWSSAIYVGIIEMALAFIFWFTALKLSESTAKISNLIFITPFLNLLFVRLLLKEQIYFSTIFGIILVITGIIIQNRTKKDV